jgi:hypothetical protein
MSVRHVPIVLACVVAALAGCGTTARQDAQRMQGAPLAATPVAALGDSAAAAAARREADRASLAAEPAQYVSIQPRLASDGELYAAVRNRAAVPATGVKFVVAVVDRSGEVKEGPYTIDLGRQILTPSEVVMVPTRLGPYQDRAVLTSVKFEVQSAQPLAQ